MVTAKALKEVIEVVKDQVQLALFSLKNPKNGKHSG